MILDGLLIPDFERKILLQLSGRGTTQWNQANLAEITGGTERAVRIEVESWQEKKIPAMSQAFLDYSPYNPTL